jgi:hypothetical protein
MLHGTVAEGSRSRDWTWRYMGLDSACHKLARSATFVDTALPLMSFMLQVRLTVMPACGQLACMDSPLGVPGELSGPLLVKRCIEVCCF